MAEKGDSVRERLIEALIELYGGDDEIIRTPVKSYYDQVQDGGALAAVIELDEEQGDNNEYGHPKLLLPFVIERIEYFPAIAREADWREAVKQRSIEANFMLSKLRRIPARDRHLGGMCTRLFDAGGGTLYESEHKGVVGAFVRLTAEYQTGLFNPDVL